MIRALAFESTVRLYAITGTQLVKKAQETHQTLPSATAALGRSLVVGAMMGFMLKGNQKLTIRIKGDGPIGEILVDAHSDGKVRGYVSNPQVHFQYPSGKLNVAQTVGTNGEIQVIKDVGMKDYYISSVELISGELGEDFTYYFAKSEQVPSSVACGVLVDTDNSVLAAGGFILQLLPGTPEHIIEKIEKKLGSIKPVSQMVAENYTPEMIIEAIAGDDYEVLSKQDVRFECDCTKERFADGLRTIGKDALREIIEEDGQAEIVCHFCNTKFHFSKEELESLISREQKNTDQPIVQ